MKAATCARLAAVLLACSLLGAAWAVGPEPGASEPEAHAAHAAPPGSGTGGDSSGEGIDPHANPEVQALQQEASQHCMNLAVSYSQRQDNPCERAHWVAEIRHVRWHMPVWGYRLA